jgi:hypothetical protein
MVIEHLRVAAAKAAESLAFELKSFYEVEFERPLEQPFSTQHLHLIADFLCPCGVMLREHLYWSYEFNYQIRQESEAHLFYDFVASELKKHLEEELKRA